MDKIKVLIVEDDFIISTHLKKLLNKMGLQQVYTARSYTKALELASENRFHILLSAVCILGEKDGIETATVLQQMYELPVVFITAYHDDETLARASKVDFAGYLLKPFREDDLRALVILIIQKYGLVETTPIKKLGIFRFDMHNGQFYKAGVHIRLSEKEQRFFQLLFQHLDSIITYELLDEVVWQSTYVSDNTRRTFIYRMKQKYPELKLQTIKEVGVKVGKKKVK